MTVLYPWQQGSMDQGSTQQRLNPNQSVPVLIPLDRPQIEWPLVIGIN